GDRPAQEYLLICGERAERPEPGHTVCPAGWNSEQSRCCKSRGGLYSQQFWEGGGSARNRCTSSLWRGWCHRGCDGGKAPVRPRPADKLYRSGRSPPYLLPHYPKRRNTLQFL